MTVHFSLAGLPGFQALLIQNTDSQTKAMNRMKLKVTEPSGINAKFTKHGAAIMEASASRLSRLFETQAEAMTE